MGVYAGRLPGKEKYKHSFYSIYEVNAGKIRKPRWDYSRTEAIEGVSPALSPDEYLLNRHASLHSYPYEEHPDLPDTALVTALHYYISQKLKETGRSDVYEVFDGTALLAMAIQLEEELKTMLGPNGHLMFAQKIGEDQKIGDDATQQ